MKKLLTIVGVLTVVATPAFAQAYIPSLGSGNLVPFTYQATTNGSHAAADVRGDQAFAMAPGSLGNGNSPTLTGGTSFGYNQTEQQNILNH